MRARMLDGCTNLGERIYTPSRFSLACVVAIAAAASAIVIIRSQAFLIIAPDPDEGVYVLMGKALLGGHLPYTTLWDFKPPGLFVAYGLSFLVFGRTYAAYPMLADVCVLTTCVGLVLAGRAFPSAPGAGWLAAALFGAASVNEGALWPQAETVYVPFVTWAFALALHAADDRRAALRDTVVAGLLAGIALQVKYLAATDALAILIAFVALRRIRVGGCALYLAMLVLPFLVDVVVYATSKRLHEYLDANVYAFGRRVRSTSPLSRNQFALRIQIRQSFPLVEFAVAGAAVAVRTLGNERLALGVVGGWCALNAAGLVATNEYWNHQFFPLLSPCALLGAFGIISIARTKLRSSRLVWTAVAASILLVFVTQDIPQLTAVARDLKQRTTGHDPYAGDDTGRLAAELRHRGAAGRGLFVVNDNIILYDLTGVLPPSIYAFTPFLNSELSHLPGIDPEPIVREILGRKPGLVVLNGRPIENADVRADVLQTLRRSYREVGGVSDRRIYERRQDPR